MNTRKLKRWCSLTDKQRDGIIEDGIKKYNVRRKRSKGSTKPIKK